MIYNIRSFIYLGVQVCGRSLNDPPLSPFWWLMSSVLDHFAKQGHLTMDLIYQTTDFEWGRSDTEAANFVSEMRGATIRNVTEVSGLLPLLHGHDYVQITLQHSLTPHPHHPSPAYMGPGPRKVQPETEVSISILEANFVKTGYNKAVSFSINLCLIF